MVYVLCDIMGKGFRSDQHFVSVEGIDRVERNLIAFKEILHSREGNVYLPVGYIGRDIERGFSLIEFNQEFQSDSPRIWVRDSSLINLPEQGYIVIKYDGPVLHNSSK